MHSLRASNKRLKLAFIPHFCYPDGSFKSGNTQEIETLLHSNIGHRADDKSSNRGFSRLTTPFGRAVAVTAAAMMVIPVAACAQDNPNATTAPTNTASTEYVVPTNAGGEAQVYNIASTTTVPTSMISPTNVSFDAVQILPDAHQPAADWVVGHPDRLAIPVRLGLDTKVAPERVELKLREDFASHGVNNVKFFYELGGRGETTLGYVSDKYVSPDVYPLATARDYVEITAQRMSQNNQSVLSLYP